MNTRHAVAVALVALAALCGAAVAGSLGPANYEIAGKTYSGDATYYAQAPLPRGFGHCSYFMTGSGSAEGYAGVPLAINNAQYTGPSVCGLCVQYRGIGQGAGGNPVPGSWQRGFVCDQCPECKHGDLDQQSNGDGRWKIEWFPVQCPVGNSNLRYGFQGGNPWYAKMQVANGRVPITSVAIFENGNWKPLQPTIDNYHEFHGTVAAAFAPCARVRVTSVLGDEIEDRVCCSSGSCVGEAQFPCTSKMPGCDGSDPSAQRRAVKPASKAAPQKAGSKPANKGKGKDNKKKSG